MEILFKALLFLVTLLMPGFITFLRYHRPRVLVCTVNGYTGVVTRRDYEWARRLGKHKKSHPSQPIRPHVAYTFIFDSANSRDFLPSKERYGIGGWFDLQTLLAGCVVEAGEFELNLGDSHNAAITFEDAYKRIHGRKPFRKNVTVTRDEEKNLLVFHDTSGETSIVERVNFRLNRIGI